MSELVVIALGGNAIQQQGQTGTYEEQRDSVELTCIQVVKLIKAGKKVIITHGNGPQVGNILKQQELAKKDVPPMVLDVCGAFSQGFIGYMLQQAMRNILLKEGIPYEVATLVTQVRVSPQDPAFVTPTKPIGTFKDYEYAKKAMEEKGETWVEDSGRGWRRVVPSPEPIEIVERNIIKGIVEKGTILIASGGGGIPVVRNEKGMLEGIEAVIDKDLAGERLAADLDADLFIILTDVSRVSLHYNTPQQTDLARITVDEAEKYFSQGHFKPGSMGPKVMAGIRFAKSMKKPAIITSLKDVGQAVQGEAGTWIVPN